VIVSVASGLVLVAVVAVSWWATESAMAAHTREFRGLTGATAVAKRHCWYAMASCVAGVLVDAPHASLRALAVLLALAVLELLAARVLGLAFVRDRLGIGGTYGVLVVADRNFAETLVADRAAAGSGAVVGVCLNDGSDRLGSVAGVPVLGTREDVLELVARLGIHEVFVHLSADFDGEWVRELGWGLEECGVRLVVASGLVGVSPGRVSVLRVGRSVVLGVGQARPTGLVRLVKAWVEGVVALVGLVVVLPVLVVCAVAVWVDSAGPVVFRQVRVRDGGRTFVMWKLRTMRVDAEACRGELEGCNEVGGGLFKMRVDPRVTRVGRVLRKLSLDELPQLVNVVRGEMALVGPRPALPAEVATYDGRARRRLGVKPGLTGLWQVSGRSMLSWDESVALDVDYVDNWSAGRDVAIALATVRAVTTRDGAY
jgi:exopolysaccharide biosynthesis polyprenyl glycosylphosphotransferase